MRNSALVSLLAIVLCGPALAGPAFAPVKTPEHVYAGGWEHFVGGGLAAFDCDGDHLPELFAAGGENPSSLLLNRSTPGGDIAFERAKDSKLALTGVTGAYPLDIDSDGLMDLVVLRVGQNLAFRGMGKCNFAEFADLQPAGDWTTAFSATWEAGENLPTLAFGNYVDRNDPKGPFETCAPNLLYRPEGKKYGAPLELNPGYCALSMLFSDWGRKGRADLRVSNDRQYYVRNGQEQLWAMEKTPRLYTAAEGWQKYAIWGMGIAERDLNGDGLPEVYLTSMGDQKLQSLKPGAKGPDYEDASFNRGITAHRPFVGDDGRPSTGWHVAFGDVQNDGRDDIFVSKGNVEQMPGSAMKDPNNLLIQQPDGSFVEMAATAGVASMARGRGAAMVDLNRDGLLDIAVVNRRAPMEVYRNVTTDTGHWLSVKLQQLMPNPDAIGAWVEIATADHTWTHEVTVGGGHVGGTSAPEHFGLGDANNPRLRVTWPDGTTSDWVDVPVDQDLSVSRTKDELAIKPY